MNETYAVYAADCWCTSCAEALQRRLVREFIEKTIKPGMKKMFPKSILDFSSEKMEELTQVIISIFSNSTMDTDEWPATGLTEECADSPTHCANHNKCLEAEVLEDGTKIGKLLNTKLSRHGINYVAEQLFEGALRKNGPSAVEKFWAERFDKYDLSYPMKVKVTDIEYDLSGDDDENSQPPQLPKEVIVDVEENPLDNDAIAEIALDEVSNITGWAVNSARFQVLDPASPNYPK